MHVQPDKLLQCRFWFSMLLSTLWTRGSESNWEGRFIALLHLIRFLWLYTGLPLGLKLLVMLQRAVDDVRNALRREPPSVRRPCCLRRCLRLDPPLTAPRSAPPTGAPRGGPREACTEWLSVR